MGALRNQSWDPLFFKPRAAPAPGNPCRRGEWPQHATPQVRLWPADHETWRAPTPTGGGSPATCCTRPPKRFCSTPAGDQLPDLQGPQRSDASRQRQTSLPNMQGPGAMHPAAHAPQPALAALWLVTSLRYMQGSGAWQPAAHALQRAPRKWARLPVLGCVAAPGERARQRPLSCGGARLPCGFCGSFQSGFRRLRWAAPACRQARQMRVHAVVHDRLTVPHPVQNPVLKPEGATSP